VRGSATTAAAHGLTALLRGVKNAPTTSGNSPASVCKGSARAGTQGKHRRLRNGRDGGGRRDVSAYIGIKTGSFPLWGLTIWSGPFPLHLSMLTKPISRRLHNPLMAPPALAAKTVTGKFHAHPNLTESRPSWLWRLNGGDFSTWLTRSRVNNLGMARGKGLPQIDQALQAMVGAIDAVTKRQDSGPTVVLTLGDPVISGTITSDWQWFKGIEHAARAAFVVHVGGSIDDEHSGWASLFKDVLSQWRKTTPSVGLRKRCPRVSRTATGTS
jgi:hypothetical protein